MGFLEKFTNGVRPFVLKGRTPFEKVRTIYNFSTNQTMTADWTPAVVP
jgi:hypothetical protein